MNEFKPNVSFSQASFCRLYLSEYTNDPFKSKTLSDNQPSELIKLCEFSSNVKWTLLYRGIRDGFAARFFHSKCDNHNNTLTILKAHGSSYIFGGFASINWESFGKSKSDPNAFLSSLTNKSNQPCKMRQINNVDSIYCRSDFGPIFGANDICIRNNANLKESCYSNLGRSYRHPQPTQGDLYLAGSLQFQLNEIEVYQKE